MEARKHLKESIRYAESVEKADEMIQQYSGLKTASEKIAFLKGMFDAAYQLDEDSELTQEERYNNCLNLIIVQDARKEKINTNLTVNISVELTKTHSNGTHIFGVYLEEADSEKLGEIILKPNGNVRYVNLNNKVPWKVSARTKYSVLRLKKIISQNNW